MNIRSLLILCLLSIHAMALIAQGLPITNEAARLCQEKKYSEAKTTIARAINDDKEKLDAYTWYVRGYIYKEIYKATDQQIRVSENREIAVESFERSIEMDKAGKHTAMSRTALKYLATTYFNDALKRTREIEKSTEKDPETIYLRFISVMQIADPQAPMAEYEVELWKSLAQSHYRLWQANVSDLYHANRSADYYKMVMKQNPDDCEANYNLAILYYNQGVYKIRKIDSSTDIMQLIMIQDESVRLFKESIPFATECFDTCPKKLDYYKALMYVNRALGKEEMYEQLFRESEELLKNGQLKN